MEAVHQAGGSPELIAPEAGKVQAFNHLDKGSTFDVDTTLEDARAGEYDGAVLPGGVANPDQLRTQQPAISFLQEFFSDGQAGRSDLPRAVDPRRGGPGPRARGSPRGRRCGRISATRAASGSTRRSSSTRAWSRAASPTTSRVLREDRREFAEGRHDSAARTPDPATAADTDGLGGSRGGVRWPPQ